MFNVSFWQLVVFPVCVCVGFSLDYKDDGVDSLLLLKGRLDNPDPSVLYKTCSDLTKVHLNTYILHLLIPLGFLFLMDYRAI